ncbi:hypothetical protein ACLI4U_16675 [Natrialbaceae archaeon A-CW2]|uniref:hypothetical protein n=1 Tax=Natronosalvus amylolyticus TaxID=2961994 RepID=UPI0020C957DD|nr:hypothetical protein [Natronosalvus amylolyticus]
MNEWGATVGLALVFSLSLWVVYQLESVWVWLVWGALMVGLSGAALIQFNR